jgi:thioredoxin reductase (NADPH)
MAGLLDVLIIGGGPAGLAAAIAAHRRGMTYQVLEKAALVNSLLHYPDEMVFFTTPELMEIGGLPFVSPNEKPSRREALPVLPARDRQHRAECGAVRAGHQPAAPRGRLL